VEGAVAISVLFSDDQTLDAQVVGSDTISDLAVLKVSATGLQAAQFADSTELRVGDAVVAIGDPLGIEYRGTMTDGIISAISRDIDMDGRTMNLIQTNAALNSGNSGGPLINCYGQVIGINTMKMGDSMSVAGVEGLGFAIPSATVSDIVNQLIAQGYVSGRPTLGISGESISNLYHFYYRLPRGLYITQVEDGSSAQHAGIEEGDILLSMDGKEITSGDDLKMQLYNYAPGDQVTVIIYRSGNQYAVTLTVEEAKG
jgi:serine protease Do